MNKAVSTKNKYLLLNKRPTLYNAIGTLAIGSVLYHWHGAFPLHCPNATKYPSTASVPINILLSIIKELSHTKLNQKTGWESRLSRHVSSQDSIFIVLLLPLDVLVLCLETVHNTWRLTRCMSMSLPVGWFCHLIRFIHFGHICRLVFAADRKRSNVFVTSF